MDTVMLGSLAFYGVTLPVAKGFSALNLCWPVMDTDTVWYAALVDATTMLFASFMLLPGQILPQPLVGLLWGVYKQVNGLWTQVAAAVIRIILTQSSCYLFRAPAVSKLVQHLGVQPGGLESLPFPAVRLTVLT